MNHLFTISAHDLTIWHVTREALVLDARFPVSDAEAPAHLRDWLKGKRRKGIIVADLADERHLIEQLPKVARRDRLALIHRRLAERFPETPLVSHLPLPGTTAVRLSALTLPPQADIWISCISDAVKAAWLAPPALTSIPFLLERLQQRNRKSGLPTDGLLVTPGANGLRLLYFRQGHLIYSRVIPERETLPAERLADYSAELARTHEWLVSQHLSEGSIDITILAPAGELEALPGLDAAPRFIDLASFGANSKVAPPESALAVALLEATRNNRFAHYNCPAFSHSQRLVRHRRVLGTTTLLLVGGCLAAAATAFHSGDELTREHAAIISKQRALQAQIASLENGTHTADANDASGRWLDETERLLKLPGAAPNAVITAVTALLNKAPWAKLESLSWQTERSERTGQLPMLSDTAPDPEAEAEQDPELAWVPTASRPTAEIQTDVITGTEGNVPVATVEMLVLLGTDAPNPEKSADALSNAWISLFGVPLKATLIKPPGNEKRGSGEPPIHHLRLKGRLPIHPTKADTGEKAQ